LIVYKFYIFSQEKFDLSYIFNNLKEINILKKSNMILLQNTFFYFYFFFQNT